MVDQIEQGRTQDNQFNHENGYKLVAIQKPEPGFNETRAGYYTAKNVEFMYRGVVHHLDIYFVDIFVTGDPTIIGADNSDYQVAKKKLEAGMTSQQRLVLPYSNSLERMERTALTDPSTKEALDTIQDIASNGGRIAFVASHGIRLVDDTGKAQSWVLQSHQVSGFSLPGVVVKDLGTMHDSDGAPRYNLMYLEGCNPDNAHIDKGIVTQPIIMHSDNNNIQNAPAKIV